jgi:hypothetical protein
MIRNTVIRPTPMHARTVELLHGTGAQGEGIQQRKKRIDGWMDGWMDGWVDGVTASALPLGDDIYDHARGFAQRIHSSIALYCSFDRIRRCEGEWHCAANMAAARKLTVINTVCLHLKGQGGIVRSNCISCRKDE